MKYVTFDDPHYIFIRVREEEVDWLSLNRQRVVNNINVCNDKYGEAGIEVTDFSKLQVKEMDEVLALLNTAAAAENMNYDNNVYFSL